jgi:hypothetical protein
MCLILTEAWEADRYDGRMAQVPVGCTLTAEELTAQRDHLLPGLLRLATERVELSTGYRYRFDHVPGLVPRICSVVELHRQCCQFFRFQIALEPGLGPITLDVSGPEAARAFLAGLDA